MRKNIFILSVLCLSVFALRCTTSDYKKIEQRELARGVRYDSLFLGIKFGMAKKDFFTHCWKLNKEGVIMQGPGNLSVQYIIDSTEMRSKTYMWFYPEFKNDSIVEMPVDFSFQAWAPWNSELSVDSLMVDVKGLLERWYGEEFQLIKDQKSSRTVWVKVDGNRRIRIFKKNISTVHVDFTNLLEVNKDENE